MAICPMICHFSALRTRSMHDAACEFACAIRMRGNVRANVLFGRIIYVCLRVAN